MRLFVDCRWFSQPRQGVHTYLVGLHEALLARQAAGRDRDIELVLGVERRDRVPASLTAAEIVELGARGFAWRLLVLPFVLRRLRIDIAHFQYSVPLLTLGTRYAVTIHDVLFLSLPRFFSRGYRWKRLPFFAFAAHRAAAVLTVSAAARDDIARFLRVARRIDVVHNGFDTSQRNLTRPVPGWGETPFLLTAGRLEPRKNYAGLARAFAASRAAADGVRLVIVGASAPSFDTVAAEIATQPGVRWLPRIDDAELNWLYANARGFVFPSFGEGFGIPVLEALRAGLPCAVSSAYPLPDVRAHCLTFDPGDEAAMTAALDALMTAPAPTGLDAVWRNYSWAAACDAYVGVLRRTVGART